MAETKLALPIQILGHLPHSAICDSTLSLAHKSLPAAIFNHSLRVYLLAKFLAGEEGSDYANASGSELLFVASLCHDLGTSNLYDGSQRFEVEGADAACQHMKSCGTFKETEMHQVWTAIALHTSPGIAERIDPFTRLVRLGVKMDFSSTICAKYEGTEFARQIEEYLPRLEIEKVLGDAVVSQARKIPDTVDSKTWFDSEKHPKASWPGILLRAHLENRDWDGVNRAF